jgi:hypothetical protein
VDPRAGLDDVEKRKFLTVPGLKLQPLGRPARRKSLYRLSHPDSILAKYQSIIVPIKFKTKSVFSSVYGEPVWRWTGEITQALRS